MTTTEVTVRELANDLLHQERHQLETQLLDFYLPADIRAATTARLTEVIRELAREGRYQTEAADVEPDPKVKGKKA